MKLLCAVLGKGDGKGFRDKNDVVKMKLTVTPESVAAAPTIAYNPGTMPANKMSGKISMANYNILQSASPPHALNKEKPGFLS